MMPTSRRFALVLEALIVLGSLAALSVVANWWVLDHDNFFGLDDFDWFRQVQVRGDEGFFTWLPTSVYNDRPIGAIVLRALWRTWGWNHVAHHAVLWTIHLLNAVLVYVLAGNLVRALDRLDDRPRFTAWLAAAIFVAWPTSTMASSWDASIFDLVGGTFLIAFLAVAVAAPQRSLLLVRAGALLLLLWLGLRTKEMLIVAPFALVAVGIADVIVSRWRREVPARWPPYARIAIGLCAVSIFYYVLLQLADTNGYGRDPAHPYFLSFAPSVILSNAARYLALFFDFGIPADEAAWPSGGGWLHYIAPVLVLALGIRQAVLRQSATIALCVVVTVMLIGPVLPLKNMQQRLYLYLPSVSAAIAIAAALATIVDRLPRRRLAQAVAALAISGGMLWGVYGSAIAIARNWWLEIGHENLKAFAHVRQLPPFPEGARVAIVNVPDYMLAVTILAPGEGDILRLLGGHPSVKVSVYEHEVPSGLAAEAPTHVIDYNGGELILRRRP